MNGRKARDLNRIANELLKDWIVRNTNNSAELNDSNLDKYLPQDTHFTDDVSRKTNFYTKRWTIKKLKKILKRNGSIPDDLTIEKML